MEFVLDLGVDIDAVDDNGETAMHAAASRNRSEPIRLLASRGADITSGIGRTGIKLRRWPVPPEAAVDADFGLSPLLKRRFAK